MDDSEFTRDPTGAAGTRSARAEDLAQAIFPPPYVAQMRLDLHEERRSRRLAGVTRAVILRSAVTETDYFFLEVTQIRPGADMWLIAGLVPSAAIMTVTVQPWGFLPALLLAVVAVIATAIAGPLLWRARVYRLVIPLEKWVRPGRNVEGVTQVFYSMNDLRSGWRETNQLMLKGLASSGAATRLWGNSEYSAWKLMKLRYRHGA